MNREWFINRDELANFLSPRAVRQFEEMQQEVATSSEAVTANVEATSALKDATVLTLSPNADLTNERVLSLGEGLEFVLTDGGVTIRLDNVALTQGGFAVSLVAGGDTVVALPLSGVLATRENVETLKNKTLDAPALSGLVNAANDGAAATAGVEVGEVYRNGSALMVRVA